MTLAFQIKVWYARSKMTHIKEIMHNFIKTGSSPFSGKVWTNCANCGMAEEDFIIDKSKLCGSPRSQEKSLDYNPLSDITDEEMLLRFEAMLGEELRSDEAVTDLNDWEDYGVTGWWDED